jgi:hypothetical protein
MVARNDQTNSKEWQAKSDLCQFLIILSYKQKSQNSRIAVEFGKFFLSSFIFCFLFDIECL